MKPKKFKGQNVVFGENQPEYQPLPALVIPGVEGEVITFWTFSDEELATMIENKGFYLSQLIGTFLNEHGQLQLNPLQPILPMADLSDNITLK